MKNMLSKLCVFTPTYNRAYILPKLYESLCRQTDKDFVWLVVDDGSTDETKEFINKWKIEKKINIEYYFQENSGKHIAFNKAFNNCVNSWITCVDSDDFLTDDAVELINKLIYEVDGDNSVIGIVGQKGNIKAEAIYKNWPDVQYCGFYEIFEKYRFVGEIFLIMRTEIARQYLFPQIKGEKFVSENILYRRIDKLGRYRLFNKIIYCFEYRSDGYTKNALSVVIRNPKGYMLSLALNIEGSSLLKERAKAYAYYESIRKLMRPDGAENQSVHIDTGAKLLSILYVPHYYLKIKRGIQKYR